jgi:hypothetical protein
MRPLNPKAMEHRTRLLDVYITPTTSDNEKGEEDYNLDDEAKEIINGRSTLLQ